MNVISFFLVKSRAYNQLIIIQNQMQTHQGH
jgi:hypothetical protein